MKIARCLALVAVLVGSLWFFLLELDGGGSGAARRDQADPEAAALSRAGRRARVSAVGALRRQQAPGVAPLAPVAAAEPAGSDGFIRRELAAAWLDPADKAWRRRVRIAEADFQYPLVRLEERVRVDPASGRQQVVLDRASVADHVLVGLHPGTNEAAACEQLERGGFAVRAVEAGSFLLVGVGDFADPAAQEAAIRRLADYREFIEFSEPDFLVWPSAVPNDPLFAAGRLWGLDNPGSVAQSGADADIDAPEGWEVLREAPQVIVAVTDTGVRYTHEDLAPNMWRNLAETAGDGVDNDGNGVVDDVFGFDALDDDGDPMDEHGHGTHCAGTIGARGNNGRGGTGVAWSVQLMALRFMATSGTSSGAIRSINYARLHGAHVINASWGGTGFSQGIYNAIKACGEAGIPFVAAAGNNAANLDARPQYPAAYDLPNIVAVAATNELDLPAHFTNTGPYAVDLAAPGSSIWSTYARSDQDHAPLSGTSMAAPHVSGALALARARFPADSGDQLVTRLLGSADPLPAWTGAVLTGGRLNLARLLDGSSPAQPNDDFAGAFRFRGDYGFWAGTNHTATREADEDAFGLPGSGHRSLWFAWQAATGGLAELVATATPGPVRIALFGGATKEELTLLRNSHSDDPQGGILYFYAEPGREYRLLVDSDAAVGQSLGVRLETTPANDHLAHAAVFGGDSFEVAGSNRRATAEPFEQQRPHAGVGQGHSVWWSWTPDFSGDFVLSTTGSEFDTVLAVYRGSPAIPGGLVEVAANDDENAWTSTSQVLFSATAGTTYQIAVDSYLAGSWGGIQLHGFRASAIQLIQQPKPVAAPLGGRATFDVVALGTGQLGYRWFLDGQPIPGQTGASLMIDPVTAADFGVYEVEIRNQVAAVRSGPAALVEQRTPPSIVSDSGNRAVVEGDPLRLTVTAVGSQPLGYVWTKDGTVIPEATDPQLVFPAVTAADAGLYQCSAGNDVGSATASITVRVVASPIDGWEWRRASVPNDSITDLKVIDGKVYAVAGERILVSDDGERWNPWLLPTGFQGHTLAKLGMRWLCSGQVSGATRMAVCDDGVTWQPPVPVTGVTGLTGVPPAPVMEQMEAIGEMVVGWAKDMPDGRVFCSYDGVNWYPSVRVDNFGPLIVDKRIVAGPGGLLAAARDRPGVFLSTDGGAWYYADIAGTLEINAVGRLQGNWLAFDDFGIFASSDGVSWQQLSPVAEFAQQWLSESVGYDLAGGAVVLQLGAQRFGWGPTAAQVKWHTLQPLGDQPFTAAVSFNGRLIYGTRNGGLHAAAGPEELRLLPGDTRKLDNLVFLNGEFIACGDSDQYTHWTDPDQPVLISGDGIHWRESANTDRSPYRLTAFVGGRYCGYGRILDDPQITGWSPVVMSEYGPGSDAPKRICSAATDGTLTLAVSSSASGSAAGKLWSVDEAAWSWSEIPAAALALRLGHQSKIQRLGGQWFLTGMDPDWYSLALARSPDGWNWSRVPGVQPDFVVESGGTIYSIGKPVSTQPFEVHQSSDGIQWTKLSVSIPADLSPFWIPREVKAFRDVLIMCGRDHHDNLPAVLFSHDGASWLRAPAPADVIDIEVAHGQLVGLTANGGIVQAGGQPPGGSAPLVHIDYPPNRSTFVVGGIVEVAGTAADPDGGPVEVDCLVNGRSIGTTTSAGFRFTFEARAEPSGYVVVVRATDDHGLVGSNELRVNTTAVTLANLLEGAPGAGPLPTTTWLEFGGALYVADGDRVLRSFDGQAWEPLQIPLPGGAITAMATGNGALVVQLANGAVATTRDGINWTAFQPALAGTPSTPLHFSGGWFVSSIANTYYRLQQAFFSKDGISWQAGSQANWPDVRSLVMTETGVIIGFHDFAKVHRSVDGGNNWFEVPEFAGTAAYQVAFGTAEEMVIAGLKDGRILVSVDDGASWKPAATVEPFPDQVASGFHSRMQLAHHAGLFLLGAGEEWRYLSRDGRDWRLITGEPVRTGRLVTFGGRYLAAGYHGVLWSPDGVDWAPVPQGPGNVNPATFVALAETAWVADTGGRPWTSTDGLHWLPQAPAAPTPRVKPAGSATVSFANLWLTGGRDGLLANSADGGLTWRQATLQGGPVPADWTVTKVVPADRFALAIGTSSNGSVVLRSEDGLDWQRLEMLRFGQIVDLAVAGAELVAIERYGKVWRSLDAGWQWEVEQIPGLLSGTAVHRFDHRWVVLGTNQANGSGINLAFTSEAPGQWTAHGAVGGVTQAGYRAASAVAFEALFVALKDGRVFRAADGNLAWTQVANLQWPANWQAPFLQFAAGRLWLGWDSYVRYSSANGIDWPASSGLTARIPLASNGSMFVNGSLTWSADGLTWQAAESPPSDVMVLSESLLWAGGQFRVADNNGAIWVSDDGRNWRESGRALPAPGIVGVAEEMVRHANLLVAGGDEGMLVASTDDGKTWQQVQLGGEPLPASWQVTHLESDGNKVFAVVTVAGTARSLLWRSSDGRDWEEVSGLAAERIADVAAGGGELLAAAAAGGLFRSADHGASWTPASGPPLITGWGIVRFAGRWVAFGTTAVPADGVVHSSADGIAWTSHGVSGYLSRTSDFYRIAHGKLIVGSGVIPLASEDGVNWAPLSTDLPVDTNGFAYREIAAIPDGYLAVYSNGPGTQAMWTLPLAGGAWTKVAPWQPGVSDAECIDGRLFLFGSGSIREWSPLDVALEIGAMDEVTAGVGSVIEVPLRLVNRGGVALPAGDYEFGAWLSQDGFFGDHDDAPVGTLVVPVPDLPAGTETSLSLGFRLPKTIPVGRSRIVVAFDTGATLTEANPLNNTAISGQFAVDVPARRLHVSASGDGRVEQDIAAMFYPHGAEVSLAATPGKGSLFAGWQGDAVGGLDQVTIVMDADKSVAARFVAAAPLQVRVRGAGSVAGVTDEAVYQVGTVVGLTAVPRPGWTFAGWSGDASGTDPVVPITIDAPKVVHASFILPVANWEGLHFTAAELVDRSVSGADSDPDGDGLTNRQEYLHGSDPRSPAGRGVLSWSTEGGFLSVRFSRLQGMPAGCRLESRASRDLVDWSVGDLEQRVLGVTDGVETVEARLPLAGRPRGFVGFDYDAP